MTRSTGIVFPLGMYTVSTFQVANAIDVQFLLWVPRIFVYVALFAWAVTFLGLLRTIFRRSHAQG